MLLPLRFSLHLIVIMHCKKQWKQIFPNLNEIYNLQVWQDSHRFPWPGKDHVRQYDDDEECLM